MPHKKINLIFGLITVTTLSIFFLSMTKYISATVLKVVPEKVSPYGVCPPFFLYDEKGNIIDPVHEINSDKPYSPKQTCGRCHDYNKITEGFHFQQGRGEKPNPLTAERCLWVTTPGNYGGNW